MNAIGTIKAIRPYAYFTSTTPVGDTYQTFYDRYLQYQTIYNQFFAYRKLWNIRRKDILEAISELVIVARKGDTNVFEVLITEEREVVNLTGATVRMIAKETPNAGSAVINKVATITTPISGVATITLLAADIAAIAPKDLYYDVRLTEQNGNVTVVVSGRLVIDQPISLGI